MALFYNGTEIKKIIYNGTEIKKATYNGANVFSGETIYKWEKHVCNVTPAYTTYSSEKKSSSSLLVTNETFAGVTATSYSFNANNGYYALAGTTTTNPIPPRLTTYKYYQESINTLWQFTKVIHSTPGFICSYDVYQSVASYHPETYSKGSYVGEVTSTNASAYPQNSYDSNHQYWYVYKGVVQ